MRQAATNPLTEGEPLDAEDIQVPLLLLSLRIPEYLHQKVEHTAAGHVTNLLRHHIRVQLNLKHGRAAFEGLE